MSKHIIDFTVQDGRIVRPASSRAATNEEIALWDALQVAWQNQGVDVNEAEEPSDPIESIPVEPIEPYEEATGPGLDTDPII